MLHVPTSPTQSLSSSNCIFMGHASRANDELRAWRVVVTNIPPLIRERPIWTLAFYRCVSKHVTLGDNVGTDDDHSVKPSWRWRTRHLISDTRCLKRA